MIYYKICDAQGNVCSKGVTCDGVTLAEGQTAISAEEYAALQLAPNAIAAPVTELPLTVEQQLLCTQLQQQEILDALVVSTLGGDDNV